MARIAVGLNEEKNKKAAQKANEEFYKNHPEMKGKPIDPCSPEGPIFQKEWMDSYVKNGGAYRKGKYEKVCKEPQVQRCPCDGRLVVSLVDSTEKNKPVSGVDVAIYGPSEGRRSTGPDGKAIYNGLEAGLYQIEVILPNSLSYKGTAEVSCASTTGRTIAVDPRKMKRVPWKWLQNDNTLIADKPMMGPGQIIKVKTIKNIILEWKIVPDDFALMKVESKTLEDGQWGWSNVYADKLCEGDYRRTTAGDTIESIGWFGMKVLGVLVGQSPDLSTESWYDGWANYPSGGHLDKYRPRTWDSLAKQQGSRQ